MSARLDPDAQTPASASLAMTAAAMTPLAAIAVDPDDRWGGHALPSDHPAWMKDTLSISQRARALIAKLKPVVVQVVGFWEHRLRSIIVGNERLSVDTSGSYRLD